MKVNINHIIQLLKIIAAEKGSRIGDLFPVFQALSTFRKNPIRSDVEGGIGMEFYGW